MTNRELSSVGVNVVEVVVSVGRRWRDGAIVRVGAEDDIYTCSQLSSYTRGRKELTTAELVIRRIASVIAMSDSDKVRSILAGGAPTAWKFEMWQWHLITRP